MVNTRRDVLQLFAAGAGAIAAAPLLLHGQHPMPEYKPSPNAPNPAYPQGMNGPGPTQANEKAIYRQNQAVMKDDIEKMYAIVSELRQDVKVTDTAAIFNIAFVKKAQQVEKLAKQVKDMAKG
jgi:hypothetical protein